MNSNIYNFQIFILRQIDMEQIAIYCTPSAIQYVKYQTPLMCNYVLMQDPINIKYIRDKASVAVDKFIKKNPNIMIYLINTEYFQQLKINKKLVKNIIDYYLKNNNVDDLIQLTYFLKKTNYVNYLQILNKKIIQLKPMSIKYINNNSKSLVRLAVRLNPKLLCTYCNDKKYIKSWKYFIKYSTDVEFYKICNMVDIAKINTQILRKILYRNYTIFSIKKMNAQCYKRCIRQHPLIMLSHKYDYFTSHHTIDMFLSNNKMNFFSGVNMVASDDYIYQYIFVMESQYWETIKSFIDQKLIFRIEKISNPFQLLKNEIISTMETMTKIDDDDYIIIDDSCDIGQILLNCNVQYKAQYKAQYYAQNILMHKRYAYFWEEYMCDAIDVIEDISSNNGDLIYEPYNLINYANFNILNAKFIDILHTNKMNFLLNSFKICVNKSEEIVIKNDRYGIFISQCDRSKVVNKFNDNEKSDNEEFDNNVINVPFNSGELGTLFHEHVECPSLVNFDENTRYKSNEYKVYSTHRSCAYNTHDVFLKYLLNSTMYDILTCNKIHHIGNNVYNLAYLKHAVHDLAYKLCNYDEKESICQWVDSYFTRCNLEMYNDIIKEIYCKRVIKDFDEIHFVTNNFVTNNFCSSSKYHTKKNESSDFYIWDESTFRVDPCKNYILKYISEKLFTEENIMKCVSLNIVECCFVPYELQTIEMCEYVKKYIFTHSHDHLSYECVIMIIANLKYCKDAICEFFPYMLFMAKLYENIIQLSINCNGILRHTFTPLHINKNDFVNDLTHAGTQPFGKYILNDYISCLDIINEKKLSVVYDEKYNDDKYGSLFLGNNSLLLPVSIQNICNGVNDDEIQIPTYITVNWELVHDFFVNHVFHLNHFYWPP